LLVSQDQEGLPRTQEYYTKNFVTKDQERLCLRTQSKYLENKEKLSWRREATEAGAFYR
jgi:hypothetical protein